MDEYGKRLLVIIFILLSAIFSLFGRIIYLGIVEHDFLLDQSNIRCVREVNIPSHRGMITDRHGKPLAISIPVASIWVSPKLFYPTPIQEITLSKLLNIPFSNIHDKVLAQKQRDFVYLKRSINMDIATQILSLKIPGIFAEKGYKRYYPEGEAAAHVIGFTNIDDQGQEGLELAYDSWLYGIPGKIRLIKDRLGNTITKLGVVREPQQGRDLMLSIDRRIQYLAYSELKDTVSKYKADSGSLVVLAVKTGEILAMVNIPSYDPNNRIGVAISDLRNRSVTDVYEPGSTIKVFSIANAINSGMYKHDSIINTNPGVLKVEDHYIHDDGEKNNGILTVKDVLRKSSNIGVAKITLSLPEDSLPNLLNKVGFGKSSQSGFPGEASGIVPHHLKWRQFVLATLSFGYSISVTPLQLAESHAVIASHGVLRPITFIKKTNNTLGTQVLSSQVCQQMMDMLESVIDVGGTGVRAQIPGYRVAGKTGTARIAAPTGGYYKDRYFANFVGIAPVSNPQLVVVVVIKNPKGLYHGGQVAAPTFAKVMNGALRIMAIPLDK